MKKLCVLSIILCLVLSSTALFAAEKISITYNWHGADAHAAWTEAEFPAFEKATGIKLDLNPVPSNQIRQKVRADLMGGVATDIILWYGGAEAHDFVKPGWLLDITALLDPIREKFLPGTLANTTFDGKNYALPLCQNFFALYLNKDIYAKYGFEPPTTYEELAEQVVKFKADGLIPIMVPGKNHPLIQHFYSFVANQTTKEGEFDKASYGDGTYKDYPGFLKAAELIANLQTKGAFDPNIDGIPMASVEDMFAQGQGAMYFAGIWRVGSLPREVREKMLPILFPVVEGFTEYPNIATSQMEMGWVVNAEVAKDKKKMEAVKTFINYFAKETTYQNHAELTDTIIPVISGVDLSAASFAVKESAKLVAGAKLRPFLRYYQSPAQAKATNEATWDLVNGRITPNAAIDKMSSIKANKR